MADKPTPPRKRRPSSRRRPFSDGWLYPDGTPEIGRLFAQALQRHYPDLHAALERLAEHFINGNHDIRDVFGRLGDRQEAERAEFALHMLGLDLMVELTGANPPRRPVQERLLLTLDRHVLVAVILGVWLGQLGLLRMENHPLPR